MKSYPFFLLLAAALFWAGCQKVSSRKDLEKIQELEARADSSRAGITSSPEELDKEVLRELGAAYVKFADNYPDAPETPEFLFRAGELYSNELQDYDTAINVFKRNYENYPEHETAANALFFIGYLYNNSLNDLIQAEKYYNEFLERYPGHKMAESAEVELASLGMTPDQLFEKILGTDSTPKVDTISGMTDSIIEGREIHVVQPQ